MMVHLVHFYLKQDFTSAAERKAFEQALDQLCAIPISPKSNWGTPASVPARPVVDSTWDYNLVTYFNSVDDHNAYQKHPDHDVFLDENKHRWEKVLIIDSELNP